MTKTLSRSTSILFALVILAAGLFALPTQAQFGRISGNFTGLSNHQTSGTVSIVQMDGGYVLHLHDNFAFDGAPDPKFGFGRRGRYDGRTTFALLQSNTGSQTYRIPANVNLAAYDEVYLWCERFSVPLGVARIR